jgi:RNA polymerase sigma-70 factor, ECF subfamily
VAHRSDYALVQRVLAGNHEACVELIGQYHAPIYRLLVHLCRDAHLAEDLAQESFLAAWAKIGSFHADSSLKTWLHKIAYRKFIDDHRRQERTVATQSGGPIEQVQSRLPSPYDTAVVGEQTHRLYQALDRLEPAQRDVLVLHYLQGLSYEELADMLDQPSGTVKWRTRKALDALRAVLEKKEDKIEP